ncbi:MAG: GNAT family N-acetyltransferase [Propionibacteriaceae bacterium]|nr:GNAT family N-acetyltransferase [Propionibacteriaceae bacterium]
MTRELIRPATGPELPELAEFLNTCWRDAYAGILADGYLAGLTTQDQTDRLRRKQAWGQSFTVARDTDGRLAGLTAYGPTHLASEAPVLTGAGELGSLYIRADRRGTGLGHHLLRVAETALWAAGYTTIGLDVFRANARAIRFYERYGYVRVGEKIDHIEGRTYPLDIMAKTA